VLGFYYSTVKMDAMRFSETYIGYKQTTRRYIPEDRLIPLNEMYNISIYIYLVPMGWQCALVLPKIKQN
jgi:hypothetical protein